MNETDDTTEKLKLFAYHVIALIDAQAERVQHRTMCASNWMYPNGGRIPFERAQRNMPFYEELFVEFAPRHDDDDPAGAAPWERYALRLVGGNIGSVTAEFVLVHLATGKEVVRYRRPPTLSDAFEDASRAQRGEFG